MNPSILSKPDALLTVSGLLVHICILTVIATGLSNILDIIEEPSIWNNNNNMIR